MLEVHFSTLFEKRGYFSIFREKWLLFRFSTFRLLYFSSFRAPPLRITSYFSTFRLFAFSLDIAKTEKYKTPPLTHPANSRLCCQGPSLVSNPAWRWQAVVTSSRVWMHVPAHYCGDVCSQECLEHKTQLGCCKANLSGMITFDHDTRLIKSLA